MAERIREGRGVRTGGRSGRRMLYTRSSARVTISREQEKF